MEGTKPMPTRSTTNLRVSAITGCRATEGRDTHYTEALQSSGSWMPLSALPAESLEEKRQRPDRPEEFPVVSLSLQMLRKDPPAALLAAPPSGIALAGCRCWRHKQTRVTLRGLRLRTLFQAMTAIACRVSFSEEPRERNRNCRSIEY